MCIETRTMEIRTWIYAFFRLVFPLALGKWNASQMSIWSSRWKCKDGDVYLKWKWKIDLKCIISYALERRKRSIRFFQTLFTQTWCMHTHARRKTNQAHLERTALEPHAGWLILQARVFSSIVEYNSIDVMWNAFKMHEIKSNTV